MVPRWEMVGIETREGNDVGAKVRNKSCCVTLRQCKIDDQGMNSERKYDMQDKGERQRRLKYDRNQTEMNANRQGRKMFLDGSKLHVFALDGHEMLFN